MNPPAGQRKNERNAMSFTLFKPTYKADDGKPYKAKVYHVRFRDHLKRRLPARIAAKELREKDQPKGR